MTVNINTDIDLQIQKLEQMLELLDLLEDKSKMLHFITIEEFAKIRNCSIATAQRIFREKTFPSERVSASEKLPRLVLSRLGIKPKETNVRLAILLKNNFY